MLALESYGEHTTVTSDSYNDDCIVLLHCDAFDIGVFINIEGNPSLTLSTKTGIQSAITQKATKYKAW